MTTELRLIEIQRQNELQAFEKYERRLRDAYRRATRQDPYAIEWLATHHSR